MAELERNIRRGGVYWIRSNDDWNLSASPMGRPAVVVSSDFGNTHGSNVNVVFTTTGGKPMSCNVPLSSTSKPSSAMCNKITTIDKGQVGNIMCVVSDEEMRAIDEALALCLGLTLHKRDLDEALEAAKAQIAGLEEELMAKRVEVAMVEKMYEKALEMLAGVHLTKDLQKKPESVKPRVPRIVEDEPEVDKEQERTARTRATTVIMDDLEYHGEKVNINTASAMDIANKTGLSVTVAYSITGTRKRNGPYSSVSDLLKVAKFTQRHMDKYGNLFTV